MQVLIVYVVVVLIWTTTPLTIQWSNGGGASFIAAVSMRMLLALVLAMGLMLALRRRLFVQSTDWKAFLVASVGIFPCMPLVYWSAQFIPSGLIPVIMGLSPFITGVASIFILAENPFNARRIAAIATAVIGLAIIYLDQLQLGGDAIWGVLGITVACSVFALSSVCLKRIGGNIDALRQTTGTLLMAAPGLVLSWWLLDGELPADIESRALLSIIYLAVFGSLLGFTLYFYLLRRLSVNVVSLIHLITPVLALCLGVLVAGENLSPRLIMGSGLVVLSLATYQGFNPWALKGLRKKAAPEAFFEPQMDTDKHG